MDEVVNKMNVYEKLQKSRVDLQNENLTKTGKNTYSNYNYFELSDFLPEINKIFNENKLTSIVNFSTDGATLTLIDSENPEERIIFNSPSATVTMKGAQEIQNLGAMQTYQRRYLYVTALEIAENDIVDQQPKTDSKQQNNKTNTNTPTSQNKQPQQENTADKQPSTGQLASLGKKAEKFGIDSSEMSAIIEFKFGVGKALTMNNFSDLFNHLEQYHKEYLESQKVQAS